MNELFDRSSTRIAGSANRNDGTRPDSALDAKFTVLQHKIHGRTPFSRGHSTGHCRSNWSPQGCCIQEQAEQ